MDNREVVVAAAFATRNANFDVSIRPVRVQLTTDGVQYSDVVETIKANTDVTILEIDSNDRYPRLRGKLAYVYVNISIELKAGTTTADLKWRVQARNHDGTWTNMCAEQTEAAIGASYVALRVEGYLEIGTNLDEIPFDLRVILQSNESKNSVVGTDIAFVDGGAGEDTITSVAAAFGDFVAGDTITVSGSASNDGIYAILSVVAATINVATGELTAEGAGQSVTIASTGQAYGKVKNDTVINSVGSVGGIG